MDTISISPLDLAVAAVLVLALAALTTHTRIGLGRQLLVAAARTTVQLLLVGFVLKAVFTHANVWWVMAIVTLMLLVAGREVRARQAHRFSGWWGYGIGTITIFLSSFVVAFLTLLVIVGPQPWYDPRYAIPLVGMILGNTMTSVALTLDNLTRLAWQQRDVIEGRLLMGQDSHAAMKDIWRQCVHSGLIPIINAMAAAGIVSLPGMMTGQILAGNPPMEAVKYQVLIMFLIAAGGGFGALGAVRLGSRRLFDARERLRLDRLIGE